MIRLVDKDIDMSNENRAAAVGHIPSGLFIITAKQSDDAGIDGFLGSWVQQVSFDPLLVSLCVKPGRPAYDAIMNGEIFTINVIGDHDKSYLKHFWSGYDPEKKVFEQVDHEITDNGAVIIKQAKSSIICRRVSSSRPGDHEVVIAEVLDNVVHDESSKPQVHIRKSGLDY